MGSGERPEEVPGALLFMPLLGDATFGAKSGAKAPGGCDSPRTP